MDRVGLMSISQEDIDHAIANGDKVPIVRGNRKTYNGNQRKKGRKGKVGFSLRKSREVEGLEEDEIKNLRGQEDLQESVNKGVPVKVLNPETASQGSKLSRGPKTLKLEDGSPIESKDSKPLETLKAKSASPQISKRPNALNRKIHTITNDPNIVEPILKTEKKIQTGYFDMSEYVDSILFTSIDPNQIITATARDIQTTAPVRYERGPNPSRIVTGTSPRNRLASPNDGTEKISKKLARRNAVVPENANIFRRGSIYFSQMTKNFTPLQEESTSSSSWSSEYSDFENYEDEKDSEWIISDGTDYHNDEMEAAYNERMKKSKAKYNWEKITRYFYEFKKSWKKKSDTKPKLEPECEKMMRILIPLIWILKLFGRIPFETYTEESIVKFRVRRLSISYIYFCLTSLFLTFNTTMMGQGFIKVIEIGKGRNQIHEQFLRLLIDKYWYIVIVTFFYLIHAVTWNIGIIFNEGTSLADYMTEFNIIISSMKYDPYKYVLLKIMVQQGWFFVYSGIIILFYFTDIIPTISYIVRGTTNLIGVLIFLPFDDTIIFSPYYYYIQTYGLIIHLYSLYASHAIVMLPVTYSHVLENMARIWNLRTAYVFGILGQRKGNKNVTYHTIIPYSKLIAEHKTIVTFLKKTGNVFTIGLGTYYVVKFFEMIFIGYRAMSVVVFPIFVFNETFVDNLPDYLPKFMYSDPKHIIIATAYYALFQSVIGWFVTTEWITDLGQSIMYGYEFARRHSILLCKNSIQRRFVMSIYTTFAPVTDCFVRATFTINRPFIYDMFFWVVTILSLLTAFSPLQLQNKLITVCNSTGACIVVSIPSISYSTSDGSSSYKELMKTTTTVVVPTTTTTPPFQYFYDCPGTWVTSVKLPKACHPNNQMIELEARYVNSSILGIYNTDCPETWKGSSYIYYANTFSNTITCDPNLLNISVPISSGPISRDDCENLELPIINPFGVPKRRAILIHELENRILCCFDYKIPNSKQLNYCNMPSKEIANSLCHNDGSIYYNTKLLDLSIPLNEYFNNLNSSLNSSMSDIIDNCLCNPLIRPTNLTTSKPFTCNLTDYYYYCPNDFSGGTTTVALPKVCDDMGIELTPRYENIVTDKNDCPIEDSEKPYKSTKSTKGYRCDPKVGTITFDLDNNERDDCGNLKVLYGFPGSIYPNTTASITAVLNNIDNVKKILCCTDYKLQNSRPNQLKYCNMPNQDIAKKFCKISHSSSILNLNDLVPLLQVYFQNPPSNNDSLKECVDECICGTYRISPPKPPINSINCTKCGFPKIP